MKKVLVCGATGFIGHNIAERLAGRNDLEVYGTHFSRPPHAHPGVRPVQADLRDARRVDEVVAGMDVIIQAAATTSGAKDIVTRPYIHVTDNAVMNSLIFRAAYEHGVSQIIFFSCSIMYQSSQAPLKETDFDAGQEIMPSYFGAGWTKVYVEKMCEFFSRLGRTKYTVIRHSNIYGPHDKFDLEHSHVFGATMTKVMTNEDGRIKVWGPGTEERDLLYIEDLVDFVEGAMDNQRSAYELVNVGSGESVSVNELVEKIIAASGRELRVEHDLSQPHIPTRFCLNVDKAFEVFGWKPRTSIEKGIIKTMAWYRETMDLKV